MAASSVVQVVGRAVARSHQLFWTMPCADGNRPVVIVACPRTGDGRAVRIGRFPEPGAVVEESSQSGGPLITVGLNVVGTHLVDDEHDQERGSRGPDLPSG